MASKLKLSSFLASSAALSLAIAAPAHADPQSAQAQANFVQADVNKDEQLDFAEFTTFINLNADHNLGRATAVRRLGMYEKAFGQVDANRDGIVSKQEIAAQAQR